MKTPTPAKRQSAAMRPSSGGSGSGRSSKRNNRDGHDRCSKVVANGEWARLGGQNGARKSKEGTAPKNRGSKTKGPRKTGGSSQEDKQDWLALSAKEENFHTLLD